MCQTPASSSCFGAALPARLARFSSRGVPVNAVITQCVIALLFVIVGDIGKLIEFVAFTLTLFGALTVAAVFVFRARGANAPYRTFGYPVTPALFVLITVAILYLRVEDSPMQSFEVLALLVVGAVIYVLTSRGKPHIPVDSTE